MRFKLTILLFVLNLILFGSLFFIERSRNTGTLFGESNRLILDASFVESISDIKIKGPGLEQDWHFRNSEGDNWVAESPHPWKANPYAIEKIIYQLRSLKWETKFDINELEDAGQSLDHYGLESPAVILELSNNNSTRVIEFGAPTEIGNRLYTLSPSGDSVYVVNQGILTNLNRDLSTFLNQQVFSFVAPEVRAIQIQDRTAGNVRVRIVRSGDNWQFVSPIETEASTQEVQSLLGDLQELETRDFYQPEDTPANFESPALRISLEGMNNRETMLIGDAGDQTNEEGRLWARREAFTTVFTVPDSLYETLRSAQEILREKNFLRNAAENWSTLEIRMDNRSTTLQRLENGSWQVVYTDQNENLQTLPAESTVIDSLASDLKSLEAVHFVSDAPSESDLKEYGLQSPQRTLVMKQDEPGSKQVILKIGNLESEGNYLYASTNQTSTVYLIRPFILVRSPLNPLHYRERTMRDLPDSAEIRSINLRIRDSGQTIISTDKENEESSQDLELIKTLKSFVRNPEVDRFLKAEFEDPLQLDSEKEIPWEFVLEAEIRLPGSETGETRNEQFFLSGRIGGTTQFVGSPSANLTGVLSLNLIDALDPYITNIPAPEEDPPEIDDNGENESDESMQKDDSSDDNTTSDQDTSPES